MTDQVKSIIRMRVDTDLTLKYIMPELRKVSSIKAKMPMKKQVANYIKLYRKQSFGEPAVSIEDLILFCENNKQIPDDLDTPWVMAYQHSRLNNLSDSSDESEKSQSGDDGNADNWFRYMVTTRRLLLNAKSSDIIHSDATNKITVQKYPLLVFGATDKTPDQKFHLFAIMISKRETADDFAFGFATIRCNMLMVADVNFSPTYLMADAAAAIANGFHRVFGDDRTVLMCESHMKRAVDRRPFHDQNNKELVKADLNKLILAYNEDIFQHGCELFLKKWLEFEPELAEYIDCTWFKRNEKWYNGAGIRTPNTNNALEGFNGVFKTYHTRRKIKNLNEFKHKLMNIVISRHKSNRRNLLEKVIEYHTQTK